MNAGTGEFQALQDRVAELERTLARVVEFVEPAAGILGLAMDVGRAQGHAEGRASVLGSGAGFKTRQGRPRYLKAVRSEP